MIRLQDLQNGADIVTAAVLAAANGAANDRRVAFETLGASDGLALFPGDAGGDAGGDIGETRDITGAVGLRRRFVCRIVLRSADTSEAGRLRADAELSDIADGACRRLRAEFPAGLRLIRARRGTPHKNETERSGVSDRVVSVSVEYEFDAENATE